MNISFLCSPFKIFDAVVGLVTVFVIGDHSLGTRANKGFKDKDVNKEASLVSACVESDATVSCFRRGLFQNVSCGNFWPRLHLSNSTYIANFISIFIIKYWTPFFHCLLLKANAARLNLSYHNVKGLTAKLQDDRLLNSNILDVVVARLYHPGPACQAGLVL